MSPIKFVCTYWFIIFLACFPARSVSQTQNPNLTFSLDGSWQFALATSDTEADRLSTFYSPTYDASAFKPIEVPSNWALKGFEPPHYGRFKGDASQGFYIHSVLIPNSWLDKRVLLHFGGVWDSAEVWLNGTYLGRHDSGFTSFAFDVTSHLTFGANNILAVRVRQVTHDYLFDTNDDWSLGGIYRDVSLETMPKARWIDRVDVQTIFDDQYRDADLKVRVMVGDSGPRGNEGKSYDLRLLLLDRNGEEVQRSRISIESHSGTDRDTGVTLRVQHPEHWTAETPVLYTLRVELLDGGQVSHVRTLAIGFRQISTAGGIFRINGQAVKLRGVDRHDEAPDVGRATTPADWLTDIELMKAANINFIRTSHYPPAAGFLDLCDRMGMYVDDEVPMGYGGDEANDPSFSSAVMLRSYETVARDVNHPSIILWSVGNEDPLTSLHMASIRTVKGLDPTRPILMPWRAEDWLPPEIDILAPHYFTAAQYDQLAGRSTRPVVTTEYTHAYGIDGFGGLNERWKALTEHSVGTGGAIWMWADQGLNVIREKPGGGTDSTLMLNPDGIDGILGSYREPQRDYWETKAVYAQVYPIVDALDFVSGQTSVRIPIRNDFDFTDLRNVKIAWALMEDDRELDRGVARMTGQPHSTAWLDFKLNAIKKIRAGATYYVWFTFEHAIGPEITRRTVELVPRVNESLQVNHAPEAFTVRSGKDLQVSIGQITYTFDPRTAQLTSASLDGTPIITDSRLTLWRPLNSTEEMILKRDRKNSSPDLDRYHTVVRSWQVTRFVDAVRIEAQADHIVDENNHFVASYVYVIHPDGTLAVRYAVEPHVQAPWLPFVGMTIRTLAELNRLRWLGLGPLDAYPNEKAAAILGVWFGIIGSDPARGVKATRWAELTSISGKGLKLTGCPYIRIGADSVLQALTSVLGRPSKDRKPEDPQQRLDTDPGASFHGAFSISLLRKSSSD